MYGQYLKALLCALGATLMLACNNSSTEKRELLGTWVTETCAEGTINVDYEGAPVSLWVKGEYTFMGDGEITHRMALHLDISCNSNASATAIDVSNSYIFKEIEKRILPDGLLGHRLNLKWKVDGAVVRETQDIYAVVLNGDRLCFSENLDLSGAVITYSDVASTDINYNKCLARGELP